MRRRHVLFRSRSGTTLIAETDLPLWQVVVVGWCVPKHCFGKRVHGRTWKAINNLIMSVTPPPPPTSVNSYGTHFSVAACHENSFATPGIKDAFLCRVE